MGVYCFKGCFAAMQVALAAETNDSSSGTVEQQHTVRNSNGAYAEQAAVR